jgi:ferritin
MISKQVQDAMNEQIKKELESAYLYLSMSAYFRSEGLDGMAQWMLTQSQEEIAHAMRFFEHISQREGRVELLPLAKPKKEWGSALEAFKDAYKHEKFISASIDDLAKIADDNNDNPAKIMLQWFITEQVEEESSTKSVVDLLERIGDSGHGLIMVDRELGARGAGQASGDKG